MHRNNILSSPFCSSLLNRFQNKHKGIHHRSSGFIAGRKKESIVTRNYTSNCFFRRQHECRRDYYPAATTTGTDNTIASPSTRQQMHHMNHHCGRQRRHFAIYSFPKYEDKVPEKERENSGSSSSSIDDATDGDNEDVEMIVPTLHPLSFMANSADIIGNVTIGAYSSVFYNCVVRGDFQNITIGTNTNIQDNSVVHVRSNELGTPPGSHPCTIGNHVTIGHSSLIHACTLHDHSFVGMQSCIMDFTVMEPYSMVGAGSLVVSNTIIKTGELWVGKPAKFVRMLTEKEKKFIERSADTYTTFAQKHRKYAKQQS